jgi:hypothetical protein
VASFFALSALAQKSSAAFALNQGTLTPFPELQMMP